MATGGRGGAVDHRRATAFPTRTRRFRGQATAATISGAITYIGLINGEHKWRLAYTIADRAADATTVVEDSVEYYLVDKNGRAGRMTLIISSASVPTPDRSSCRSAWRFNPGRTTRPW